MKKPILLLDVDGVLNVPRKRPTLRPIKVCPTYNGKTFRLSFWPTNRTARFMRMAWDLFDVRWLTCWGKGGDVIAKRYGLSERPEIRWRPHGSKGAGAAAALRDWTGRVAWIEDGISDQEKVLVASKGWSYFHCDPFVGVTGEHMKALRAFARGGEEA